MAIGGIVASNYTVNASLVSFVAYLNGTGATCRLRLFSNAIVPTPATLLAAFTEATFAGYSNYNLTGLFPAPIKIIDGEYQSTPAAFSWTGGAGANQTIYGFYIDDGTNVLLSQAFSTALLVGPGSTFNFTLNLQNWSLCIVA